MTDTQLLEQKIKASGRTKRWLAEQLGITYSALWSKIKNKRAFKVEEISKLCELLEITSLKERENIFFKKDVGKMPTNLVKKGGDSNF